MLLSTRLLDIVLEALVRAIRKRKKAFGLETEKRNFLLADNMIIYVEHLIESAKTL